MKNKIVYSGLLIFALSMLFSNGCGIYTTENVLNPPYSISITEDYLSFYGDNQEDSFIGYNIWYKENSSDTYKLCYYKYNSNTYIKPTLPKDMVDFNGDSANIVYFSDLFPQESDKSFLYLSTYESKKYYFAISSYGINGEESEKVEFGLWPNQ